MNLEKFITYAICIAITIVFSCAIITGCEQEINKERIEYHKAHVIEAGRIEFIDGENHYDNSSKN